MNRRLIAGLAGLVLLFALGGSATAAHGPTLTTGAAKLSNGKLPAPLPAHGQRSVCTAAVLGLAHCDAHIVTADGAPAPLATSSYQYGYTPQNLAGAYKWSDPTGSAWNWNGQTIAIVDAYDNPNVESDLAVYRSQFGLSACSTANGCFSKVNQRGSTAPPAGNTGWGQEIALDVEMVSAVCPNCKILLVEADSNSFADLGVAVNEAATLGATAISNSYGGSEFFGETSYAGPYNHPNIAITASSGDGGYGVEAPAAYNTVVAVGGTRLNTAANARSWTETAWSGAGSGCSSQISKPSWQTDTGCSRRTVADVSAVADPNTGVAVYDSYGSSGGANWYVFGGTSVAAPIIASVYGLAGNAGATNYPARLAYASPGSLFDVTSGSNGNCSRGKRNTSNRYLCTAGPGYDGPTGLGTPNGLGGF